MVGNQLKVTLILGEMIRGHVTGDVLLINRSLFILLTFVFNFVSNSKACNNYSTHLETKSKVTHRLVLCFDYNP